MLVEIIKVYCKFTTSYQESDVQTKFHLLLNDINHEEKHAVWCN